MSKNNYSANISKSLDGRTNSSETPQSSKDGSNNDDSKGKSNTKKSNAGRKKMDVRKKKKQMVLTLSPNTYNRLIEWADKKPRSAPNYLSEYVEEHLDDIIK